MTFEEALKLLKQGKKIRRTDWGNENCYISFNLAGTLLKYFWIDRNDYWDWDYYSIDKNDVEADWEEYEESLLTKEEKEYLKMVIKYYPFEISKVSLEYDDEYAYEKFIKLHNSSGFDEAIYVKSGSFMSLELEKEYTLEELGLED